MEENILVSSHSFTSPLVRAPPQLPISPSPTTSGVDNFQHLIFGNSQSPDKFTGKPKIVSHPKSSQKSLKHKSTFTFTLRTIYPSTRSMAQPDISPDIKNTRIRPSINEGFLPATKNYAILAALLQHEEDNFLKRTVKNRSQQIRSETMVDQISQRCSARHEVHNLEDKEHIIMRYGDLSTFMQQPEEDEAQKLMEKE